MVRLQPDNLAALDAYIASQPDAPSRPEAIRRLIELGLKADGPDTGDASGEAGVAVFLRTK